MLVVCNKGTYSSVDSGTGIHYVAKEGRPINVSEKEGNFLLREFPERFKTVGKSLKRYRNIKTFTDIIVPTYKNEDYTIACFKSIKECTKEGTYKIFWVDGNSGKKSRGKVSKILKGINHKKIFLNDNLGFVKATNAGLKESRAPTVCFLNNDVYVTPKWLEKLNNILLSNNLGIVGPLEQPGGVSAQSYSWQIKKQPRLLPDFIGDVDNLKDIARYNLKIESMFSGEYIPPPNFVAFFCAVLRREVINKVGFLDTKFTIGLWDDCDYCDEATYLGFGMGVALDTMIYHKGNATFKLDSIKKNIDFDFIHQSNEKLYRERKIKRRKQ